MMFVKCGFQYRGLKRNGAYMGGELRGKCANVRARNFEWPVLRFWWGSSFRERTPARPSSRACTFNTQYLSLCLSSSIAMGIEEQKEEREVLDSIFPEEIQDVSDTEFRISIQLEVTNDEDDDSEARKSSRPNQTPSNL
jgi:hypothetical protein